MNYLYFGGQMSQIKVTVTSCMSPSRQRYILETAGGNFITFMFIFKQNICE